MKKIIASITIAALALSLCACDDFEDFEEYSEDNDSGYADDEDDEDYSEDQYGLFEDELSDPDVSYEDDYSNYDYVEPTDSNYGYDYSLGSAKELDGKIAIVSMFINDNTTSWDFEDEDDLNIYNTVYTDLIVATEYLEKVCNDYGHHPEFIFDWTQHPELFYAATLNMDYQTITDYNTQFDLPVWNEIETNISESYIRQATGADQVLYMAYFDTPASNEITCRTRNYFFGMQYPYEVCYMFMTQADILTPPSYFAHEMLHAFGAPDLYYAGTFGITQEYVDYVEENKLNDLMRICQDPETYEMHYDSIVNEITDITAYYIGLTDYSETVEEWGFEPGEHQGGRFF